MPILQELFGVMLKEFNFPNGVDSEDPTEKKKKNGQGVMCAMMAFNAIVTANPDDAELKTGARPRARAAAAAAAAATATARARDHRCRRRHGGRNFLRNFPTAASRAARPQPRSWRWPRCRASCPTKRRLPTSWRSCRARARPRETRRPCSSRC